LQLTNHMENWEKEGRDYINAASEEILLATSMKFNEKYYGFMHPPKDIDYFKFPVNSREEYIVEIQSVPGVEMFVVINDSMGRLIPGFKPKTIKDESPYMANVVFTALKEDTFVLKIRDHYNKGFNAQKSYSISVRKR